jgi:hypothetical protein
MAEIEIKKKDLEKAKMKAAIREKARAVRDWYVTNQSWVNVVPAAAAVIFKGGKELSMHVRLNKQKNLKDLYCYDHSLGHYWQLKRKLTNADWTEINRRKKAGEKLGDILESLKVLK